VKGIGGTGEEFTGPQREVEEIFKPDAANGGRYQGNHMTFRKGRLQEEM
jgi:hypothetical protein